MLKSQIRIETGDKNARNESLILLFCSVIKVSTNTNDFVNQMITENKSFCTSLSISVVSVSQTLQRHRLYICNIWNIFFTNYEVHLYEQMLYRDIWMETSMWKTNIIHKCFHVSRIRVSQTLQNFD